MPLLKNQPFKRLKPPTGLAPDSQVFYCKPTKEIFADYEDYYRRALLCNSLVWSCSITGRSGLTFEEALESETRGRKSNPYETDNDYDAVALERKGQKASHGMEKIFKFDRNVCSKSDDNGEKKKNEILSERLALLLHARQCLKREKKQLQEESQSQNLTDSVTEQPGDCGRTHCRTMRNVLGHMERCSDSAITYCTVKHCTVSKDLLFHWENCKSPECATCLPLRQENNIENKQDYRKLKMPPLVDITAAYGQLPLLDRTNSKRMLEKPLEENMNNERPKPPKRAKTEETKTLGQKKVIQSEVWAEFVTFSRFAGPGSIFVSKLVEESSGNETGNTKQASEIIGPWNPYNSTLEHVSIFLQLHQLELRLPTKELAEVIKVLNSYLPHLGMVKKGHAVDVDWILSQCKKSVKIPRKLAIIMKNGDIQHQDTWNTFVASLDKIKKLDPFRADILTVRNFIVEILSDYTNPSNLLHTSAEFYQDNVQELTKQLGFYLEDDYKTPILESKCFQDLMMAAESLDNRLIEPPGQLKRIDKEVEDLIKRVAPDVWYVKYKTCDNVDLPVPDSNKRKKTARNAPKPEFWNHGLVRKILADVESNILSAASAAWQLGVTTDMIHCAVQRGKQGIDELSTSLEAYVDQGFGTEKDFWNEENTQRLLEDLRNRVVSLDSVAFEIGISSVRLMKKVGHIKTVAELEAEKVAQRAQLRENLQKNSRASLTPLEIQIQIAEKASGNMSEYEKMRLKNMKERLELFNKLGMDGEKRKVKIKTNLPKKELKPRAELVPREKSERIRMKAEQKIMTVEKNDTNLVGSFRYRQSPHWAGKTMPTRSMIQLGTHKLFHLVSPEEMNQLLPVPKINIPMLDVIAKTVDYHKAVKFVQRMSAEVKDSQKERKRIGNVDGSNTLKAIGGGKVSSQELVSVDMKGDFVSFGDKTGGVGLWMGQRSLLFRPHNMAVTRTVFTGVGPRTQLVSASFDGTVRLLDISTQELQLVYSWPRYYNCRAAVTWLETVDDNNWLINCQPSNLERGGVMLIDKRKPTASKLQLQDYRQVGGRTLSVNPTQPHLLSTVDYLSVKIFDIRNCGAPVSSTPMPDSAVGLAPEVSWSKVDGTKLMTCPGTKETRSGQEAQLSIYSSREDQIHKLLPIVETWPKLGENKYLSCQGAEWSPWQENVCFITAKQKKNPCTVIGVDVVSGDVVVKLHDQLLYGSKDLSGSKVPPFRLICHPTRERMAVINSNGDGFLTVFGGASETQP